MLDMLLGKWKFTAAAGLLLAAGAISAGGAETTPLSAGSHIFASELSEQTTFQRVFAFPEQIFSTASILRIQYPPQGAVIRPLKESFILGYAAPRGKLAINGQSVPIHPEGGFLAMIPFAAGDFQIRAELVLDSVTYTAINNVWVNSPSGPAPEDPLEIHAIVPRVDRIAARGERLVVLARGSPKAEAFFEIHGMKGKFPLLESSGGAPGIYQGSFLIPADAHFEKTPVKVTFVSGRKKVSKESAGMVSLLDPSAPWLVQVTTDSAIIKSGPKLSDSETLAYVAFLPEGVVLEAVGRRGDEIEVKMSDAQTGWVSDKEVASLPKGTLAPWTAVRSIRAEAVGHDTEIRIPLNAKLPFQVMPLPDGTQMDVVIHGASSNLDSLIWTAKGTVVNYMQAFHEGPRTVRVRFFMPARSWWGYDARYEGGTLVIQLRRPPPLARGARSPIEGLTIAVDAGHSADSGAIGPTGLVERDINWTLSQKLAEKLSSAGAKVFMVREGSENMPLYDRGKKAWRGRADILISVHNNALPDGANPFERNGTEVYFFHPQSFELAKAIHAAYGRRVGRRGDNPYKLRDDVLQYENLALTRPPQMPAVLTESAYIMKPEEESLLKKEKFQNACVMSMVDGVKEFARKWRPLEPPKPARKKPAAKS